MEEEEEGVGLGSSDASRWCFVDLVIGERVETLELGESGATTGERPLKGAFLEDGGDKDD